MFTTGLIVFRETLEAALFIGIMAAATRGLKGRIGSIVLGLLAGLAGSLIVAGLINEISNAANGSGQEWLNIIVLSLAFIMLTWHVIWSNQHGREMAQEAKKIGAAAKVGRVSLWAISIAVAMIVLREGSETVLFVKGALASHDAPPVVAMENSVQLPQAVDLTAQTNSLPTEVDLTAPQKTQADALPTELDLTKSQGAAAQVGLPNELDLTQGKGAVVEAMPLDANNGVKSDQLRMNQSIEQQATVSKKDVVMGGLAGLFLGILVGAVLYFGLAVIPMGQLFSLTNIFVVLLAAGMAGQIGNKLVQADVLPSGMSPLWNTSSLMSQDGPLGTFFHALMGYEARPSLTHVVFFVVGLLLILGAERWAKGRV